ncbi:hypothetical protein P22_3799 [Propionispora sp. 2/2-37]|uniref:aldo/keto reductase n=1 Tax=Propionispora sp. 2/2-37 TaxID=1677858 RepID=UPI0006BB6434|nr:aldo/keto reductase [Propionispora sp. 2/2-37]CUH97664.1 hypothetical protein P22_3799 [Propionispora sp. 2/2-37]
MLYRQFGKTNESVSILGFGCMRLPVIDGQATNIDEEKATKMIRYAIDAGVNYVDTAYPYHGTGMDRGGASEPFVGRVLQGGYRQKVKLATKLPSWLIKSRSDMDKYLNEQLDRLQTDFIDFYLVHSLNSISWPVVKEAGVFEFLEQAMKDGRIRHAGFSFHDRQELFKQIVDAYDWSFCQIQYNYLDEYYQAGREGLEYAAAKDLGIAIMEPLRGGKIIHLPQAAREVFDRSAVKRSPAEWGLRWVWDHPEVAVVLSGMTTMEQVVENVSIAQEAEPHSLSAAELAAVNQVKRIFKERIKINCTACGYCMPCPAGINIPDCLAVYNDYHVFDNLQEARAVYGRRTAMTAPASKCVECGRCESHCPQTIAIRDQMKKIKAAFE